METAFEKIGIYDLIAVFLLGACSITVTCYLNGMIWENKILTTRVSGINSTITFWVFSYLVGVFLLELSSLIYKLADQNRRVLIKAYGDNDKHGWIKQIEIRTKEYQKKKNEHYTLTDFERQKIQEKVKELLNISKNGVIELEEIYDCCKYYLIKSNEYKKIADKDQAIHGFSRGMGLYFVIMGCIVLCTTDEKVIFLIMFLAGILMSYRSVRFARIRYVNIMRIFLYTYSNKSKRDNEKKLLLTP